MKLETERLFLRPWSLDDVAHYQSMSRDVGYNCFNTPGVLLVKDDDEAKLKINERMQVFENHQIGKFLVFEKSSDAFVGTCGANFFNLDGNRELEIGYRMMLRHWGKGYATEASVAAIEYFLRDLNHPQIFGFALPQNIQSVKILEKLKFEYQKDFLWTNLLHKLYRKVR